MPTQRKRSSQQVIELDQNDCRNTQSAYIAQDCGFIHFPFFFLLLPLALPLAGLLEALPATGPESELLAAAAAAAAAAAGVAYMPGGNGWFFRCFGTSSAILMSKVRPEKERKKTMELEQPKL